MTTLTSGKGASVLIGRELRRGGEGSVFELQGHSDLVAKLYHSAIDQSKARKLMTMSAGATDKLRSISAWPVDTLHDPGGTVRGFVMRRVVRQHDIHVLYGPKTRLREYPEATFRFLVHVATNLARAFAVVHEHGHVIGDVNQGGVFVSPQGTVTLVDCDSFQIRGPQGHFTCDVGIPIYQPPEFQNVTNFSGLQRTPNHDLFGLSVLIFQTLFLARHPFAGAFQGAGDMPIERAIREFRFAYGREAARRQMRQPPGSLGLGSVPAPVAEAFERAFSERNASGGRPTALEWVTVLEAFLAELRDCPKNPHHAYAKSLSGCPLCDIELRTGAVLFHPSRTSGANAPVANIEQVWRDLAPLIASVQVPAQSAVFPPPELTAYIQRRKAATRTLWIGIAASTLLAAYVDPTFSIGLAIAPAVSWAIRGRRPAGANDVETRLLAAEDRASSLLGELEQARSASAMSIAEKRAEELYQRLKSLERRRQDRFREFEGTRNARQLRRFLDRFEVKDARLKGFGPSLFMTLLSNGVETADDVTRERLSGLRGFGPKRISALLDWRRDIESRFRFNPNDPWDVQERARLERDFQAEHARDVAEFLKVAAHIRAHAGPLSARVSGLIANLIQAQSELAVLRASAEALRQAA